MEWEIYKKCIDEIKEFPVKIKTLLFTGMGEPLLHPQIARMVDYAKKNEVAETVRIITNASVLNQKLSDELIAAKLDSLKISIQGTSNEKYKEMCKSPISIETIIENITYFYKHKTNTVVNIKTVHEALEDEEDEKKFYYMFGDICDLINIEFLQEYPESDISNYSINYSKNQTGQNVMNTEICSIPFYYYELYTDGEILPTCALLWDDYKSISLGNIRNVNMKDIWTSQQFNMFRVNHLNGKRKSYNACAKCDNYIQSLCRKEDDLKPYKEKLLSIYRELVRL